MRGAFFPLGAIPSSDASDADPDGSLWRETAFACHLIRQAVNPHLALADCIEKWHAIARDLAEPPRQRQAQMTRLAHYF